MGKFPFLFGFVLLTAGLQQAAAQTNVVAEKEIADKGDHKNRDRDRHSSKHDKKHTKKKHRTKNDARDRDCSLA